MHQLSVDVFTQFLGSLSDLLDRAAAYPVAQNIDPAVLLNAQLYLNMYNLARQVGETNRHWVPTTAYGILRHCGVDLVKTDFLGTPNRSPESQSIQD